MRKDGNGNGRSGRDEAGMDFSGVAPFAAQGLEAMMRAGNAWMKGVGSLNEEMLSFSQDQLGKYMDASQSLLRCSSLEQALSTQCDLARSTLETYSREANKLMSLTAQIARDTWMSGEAGATVGER